MALPSSRGTSEGQDRGLARRRGRRAGRQRRRDVGVVARHPVPARALGAVERRVGPLEQRLDGVARAVLGDAEAPGHRADRPVDGPLHDGPQLLGQPDAPLGRGGWRQHHELLTAPAPHGVGVAEVGLHDARGAHQHLVPGRVAVLVVDPLEVVEVEHHHREGVAVAAGPLQLGGVDGVEAEPVEDPGQRVGVGAALRVARPALGGAPPVVDLRLGAELALHGDEVGEDHGAEQQGDDDPEEPVGHLGLLGLEHDEGPGGLRDGAADGDLPPPADGDPLGAGHGMVEEGGGAPGAGAPSAAGLPGSFQSRCPGRSLPPATRTSPSVETR